MTTAGAIVGRFGVIRAQRPLGSGVRTLRDLRLTLVAKKTPSRDAPGPEMVWLRRPSWVLLRRVETHHAWHLSPLLSFPLSMSLRSFPLSMSIVGVTRASSAAASSVAVATTPADVVRESTQIVARGLETVMTRHTRSLLETLVARRERVPSIGPVSAACLPAPLAPRPRALAADAPAPSSPRMVLSHAQRSTAGEGETRPGHTHQSRGPEPTRAPQPAPRVPDLQIERIADQVVRALDHRLIAWRERMGRS
jgi:hypothetical protein